VDSHGSLTKQLIEIVNFLASEYSEATGLSRIDSMELLLNTIEIALQG
jgi:hypothetical protein